MPCYISPSLSLMECLLRNMQPPSLDVFGVQDSLYGSCNICILIAVRSGLPMVY